MTILSILAATLKMLFHDELQYTIVNIGESENIFLCGDFNGHNGSSLAGYDGFHGGFGIGERNVEGKRILEFSVAHDLAVCNSLFQKRATCSHLVTYQSDGVSSQVDYVLTRLEAGFQH